jgi:hypothetical protein
VSRIPEKEIHPGTAGSSLRGLRQDNAYGQSQIEHICTFITTHIGKARGVIITPQKTNKMYDAGVIGDENSLSGNNKRTSNSITNLPTITHLPTYHHPPTYLPSPTNLPTITNAKLAAINFLPCLSFPLCIAFATLPNPNP